MEISSSSSSFPELESLEGLEKDEDEDEEEILDSSGEEKTKIHQPGEFLVKVVKNIEKLEQFSFSFCFKESGKLTFALFIIIIFFFFVFFLLRTKPLPPLQFSGINLSINFLLSDNRDIIIMIILSMTMALNSSVYRMNGMHDRQSRFTHDEGESPEFGFDGKGIWKRRRSVTEVSLFH